MTMAKSFIESMTTGWEPDKYYDDYHEALEKLIEEKIEHPEKGMPAPAKRPKATNVVDLVSVLQESLKQFKGKSVSDKEMAAPSRSTKKSPTRKKAA